MPPLDLHRISDAAGCSPSDPPVAGPLPPPRPPLKRDKYIPAGWPDAATLAFYLPHLADFGARVAAAQQRDAQAADEAPMVWST